ncbi:MAG: DUF455 family protein [Gammaproteobacteria bacterium]|nr:DUF455 family protein [Gammaproteobacteria bacterium]NBY22494.1 DUF455 family protein [Gammaproteobacteria bacterium]
MLIHLQTILEQGLFKPSVAERLSALSLLNTAVAEPALDWTLTGDPEPATAVLFPDQPVLVDPRELPKRSLSTLEGRIALLHAVAHIEFTAIALALDMAYRFRSLGPKFCRDWCGVALDEARHFKAVEAHLIRLGSYYGALPAHRGLWELAEQTSCDLLARLALIPRFMEARGLDVTPMMINKCRGAGDHEAVAILEMILEEEVEHVRLGSYWFQVVALTRGLDPEATYFDLIHRFIQGGVRGPFNLKARKEAGFSERELSLLGSMAS